MNIVTVNSNDITVTSNFAKEVFTDYYLDLLGIEQCNYMTELFLSESAIRKLMDKGAVFRLLYEDDKIIGFTEYIKEENRVFLSKLYLDKNYRHKGYGRILFDDCVRYTKDNNLDKIYLTVNKYNTPSFEIYKHLGFKVIDSVVSDIGNGYVMDDYVMELSL